MDRTAPHLVFLFSDTGGGHRSAAEAIISALGQGYPGQFTYDMVDIFRDYAPALLDRIPDIYPSLSRNPKLLGQIFYLSDDPRRLRTILKLLYPYIRTSLDRFLAERPADLFVSVHPLINIPLGFALEKRDSTVPVVTVVTDLVSAHTSWFSSYASSIIVPTPQAYQVGLLAGISPDRLKVIGLPVADGFARQVDERAAVRSRLGWPPSAPLLLLMGGGEGMGNLEGIAAALDAARLPVTLVIVAGRNEALRSRLEARQWNIPVRVYGFVREMPDFMHAADILLTKAGPGTISEAISAGLPVILYSRLDGSEDGNVRYVVDNGAGIWAPTTEEAVAAVQRWLDDPGQLAQATSACLALARPRAAHDIAALLMAQFHEVV